VNWILWLLWWSVIGVPSLLLVADRILDADSSKVIRRFGLLYVLGSLLVAATTAALAPHLLELVAWGALVGLAGTITLDLVRLVGLAAGAFPLDMPLVFGAMATGTIGNLQAHVMAGILRGEIERGTVARFVTDRVACLPRLSDRQRSHALATMTAALGVLDEHEAGTVRSAQFAALSALPPEERRRVMSSMDAVGETPAGQPRGLPRVPMGAFRHAAARALAEVRRRAPVQYLRSRNAGYLWHAANGLTFGVAYALLAGRGSLTLALAWGVFVWLAMMVAMPAMMPTLAFPWWFPVVPLLAHVAMVVPFLLLAGVPQANHAASLLGWLTS